MAVPGLTEGLFAAGSAVAGNIWNAREARRNREFQERMSSTAWQREVADMRKAGINPIAKFGHGASTPGGDRAEMEDVGGKGISSALQARLVKAQAANLEAQTELTTQQRDITHQEWQHWRPEQWNLALEKARAEVQQLTSSAQAAKARALLDEAARQGALNEEEWERRVGEMGPAVRAFIQLLRGVRR